ncbi:TetR/AcrR family transcriptional regulator [Nocardioides massiliensis]|uniref:AcrR family transcriptional regulator n=1 Tax=Nocardioides massiliensis TaxID=1325935 RepID=A0ABT9NLY9_9ACTN|nr:TetR/AcrR family transcriptional regulator [Nocardioides massiliensis]MDP9821438.1 AcrR family transcriptional regulator [Nocardioides massiliensis]
MPTPRRTPQPRQARATRTRQRIIDETARCVVEEGYAAATTPRILERAGATWGVVQYHFANREGLLVAVVEAGTDQLVAGLAEVGPADPGDADQVRRVVDAAWEAFAHPLSVASFEILIATRGMRSSGADLGEHWRRLEELGAGLFAAPESVRLARLVWATLRGLVMVQMLVPEPLDPSRELATLTSLITAHVAAHRDAAGAEARGH